MKKMLRNALIALLTCSTSAFAATTAASDGGFLVSLFVGFFALILVFQLVPACIMLFAMIKGLVSSGSEVHH